MNDLTRRQLAWGKKINSNSKINHIILSLPEVLKVVDVLLPP